MNKHWLQNHHEWQLVSSCSICDMCLCRGKCLVQIIFVGLWIILHVNTADLCQTMNENGKIVQVGNLWHTSFSMQYTRKVTFAISLYSTQMGLSLWWIFAPLGRSIVWNWVRMLKLGHVVVFLQDHLSNCCLEGTQLHCCLCQNEALWMLFTLFTIWNWWSILHTDTV